MKINLNKKTRLARLAATAVLALLFAGSGLLTVAAALDVRVPAASVYLAAAASVAMERPLLSSLTRMDAERVYTGGVVRM